MFFAEDILLLYKATRPESAVLGCSILARHVKHGSTLLQLSHPIYLAILVALDSCFPVRQTEVRRTNRGGGA